MNNNKKSIWFLVYIFLICSVMMFCLFNLVVQFIILNREWENSNWDSPVQRVFIILSILVSSIITYEQASKPSQ